MKNINEDNYKEFINSLGGKVISIDLTTPTSYFNPFEIRHTQGVEQHLVEQHLSEHITPLIKSIAENFKGFTLTELEIEAIEEAVVEMHDDKQNLNILTLRNVMIEKTSNNNDLTRLIELLNTFL